MFLRSLLLSSLLVTSMLTTGCVKEEDDTSTSEDGSSTSTKPFETDCGVVIDSSIENPVKPKDGIKGKVTVVGGNLVIIKPDNGGGILVKLHGIGVPYSDALSAGAQRILGELAKEEGVFFPAGQECTARVNSAVGTIGQVFTTSGKSYSETLINQGYGRVDNDGCYAPELFNCYEALVEEAARNVAGEVEAFLWKPISDSNGKLAIHATPADTVIDVNGEIGQDFSGGNGYANLVRFSKPGCSYGKNVTVKITNSAGVPYRFAGKTTITIPDGCQRYCIRSGSLVPCPK